MYHNRMETRKPQPEVIAIPRPQSKLRATLHSLTEGMTDREIYFLSEGIKWATLVNTAAWCIFIYTH